MNGILNALGRFRDRRPPSKTQMGLCHNKHCDNKRRHGSAYCEECAIKHRKKLAVVMGMDIYKLSNKNNE